MRQRFARAAIGAIAEPEPNTPKPPPGEPMPQGAPLRFRTPQYEQLVAFYADRLVRARASGDPRELAKARQNVVHVIPSDRGNRRANSLGPSPYRPLQRHERDLFMRVNRYAMLEAFALVDGAESIVKVPGRFPVRGKGGKSKGFQNEHRFSAVGAEGGAA